MEGDLSSSKALASANGAQSSPLLRRTANYQPSLWDDNYIQSLPDGSMDEAQVNLWGLLKEDVRYLIDYEKQKDIIELLEIVDALCQLGISYHFDREIKNVLSFIATSLRSLNNILKNNLHSSALLFRLLREHGIKVPNSRWWKSLDLIGDELNFVRDRLMENYFWSVGCTFEPQFWRCRKEITKIGCFITIIDDIYDVYGSLDELMLFTNAVDEWKITQVQQLPNYMKKTLMALFNTMNDIACIFSIENGLDILPQLKRLWGDQCKGYLVEAIWYNTRYTPTFHEYMKNAWLTVGVPLVLTSAYCLSEDLTAEALNSIEFHPKVTRYSSFITRLYDDLATSTDELKRGDVPKSIQCYMNEENVSESVARNHIRYLIKKYWKLLNYEYNHNFNMEESFKRHVLNFPRVSQFLYQKGDGYGKPDHETRDSVISLLIKPIPL